jgi:hypothetical protein
MKYMEAPYNLLSNINKVSYENLDRLEVPTILHIPYWATTNKT